MKRLFKRLAVAATAAALLLGLCVPSAALPINSEIGDTYFYNQNSMAIACPIAYRTVNIKGYEDLGASASFYPSDMCARGDYLYVLDRGGNQVLILDQNYTTVARIDRIKSTETYTVPDLNYYNYDADGTRTEDPDLLRADKYTFNAPSGIFVSEDEEIYVADTENRRVVMCDFEGNCLRVYQAPEINALGVDYVFRPQKIVVDNTGMMYIIAYGVNRGLVELDANGEFVQFFASPKVTVSVQDFIASLFQSRAEKAKIRDVAAEYVNVGIDDRGFLYTTATDTKNVAALRRIAADGSDVLNQTNARFTTIGDLAIASQIVDVAVNNENDTYTVLDALMGRFFTYSGTGMLLYMGGGAGNQYGRFKAPNVIECRGNQIVVSDASNQTLSVYETTDYALAIHDGFSETTAGHYEAAMENFARVIQFNSNMYVANENMGNIEVIYGSQADDDDPERLEHYRRAMNYYQLSETKKGYSDCYGVIRTAEMESYFMVIFISVIVLVVGLIVLFYIRKRRKARQEEERRLDLQ